MWFYLFQLVWTIVCCIVAFKKTAISFIPTDLQEEATSLWIRYKYLDREWLKMAVYNRDTALFDLYKTNGTQLLFDSTTVFGLDKRYNVIKEEFEPLDVYLTPPTMTFTSDGPSSFIKFSHAHGSTLTYTRGLALNENGKLYRNFECDPNKKYPVTNVDYKNFLSAPSSVITPSVIPNIFFTCENGKRELGECPEGRTFDGSDCVVPIVLTAAPLRKRRKNRDGSSYLDFTHSLSTIVNCAGGVDSTGIKCKDARCKEDGMRMIKMKTGGELLRPKFRKSGAHYCQYGQIQKSEYCDTTPTKVKVSSDGVIQIFEDIYHYPKQYFSKAMGTCTNTTLDMLNIPYRNFPTFSYLAASGSFRIVFEKDDSVSWHQHFERVAEGIIVPDISNPRVFYTCKGGVISQFTTSSPSVVYKNKVYSAIVPLPELNRTFTTYNAQVIKYGNRMYNVVGNVIMDILEPSVEEVGVTETVKESFGKVYDDFFHMPLGVALLRITKGASSHYKYTNINNIYGLTQAEVDGAMYQQMVEFYKLWTNSPTIETH